MYIISNVNFSEIHSKIVELEEELRVVGNNLKSLEVSEEKVCKMFPTYFSTIIHNNMTDSKDSLKYKI